MAKSSKGLIHGMRWCLFYQSPSHTLPPTPISSAQSRLLQSSHFASHSSSTLSPSPNPRSPNCLLDRFTLLSCNSRNLSAGYPIKLPSLGYGVKGLGRIGGNGLGSRFFSSNSTNYGKFGAGVKKSVVEKPLSAVSNVFSRYRDAFGLQIEAFLNRNYGILLGVAGVGLCLALWRIMFGVASTFIGFSEGMAKYGFLGVATTIVAFTGLYIRSRFTLNPDKIYRIVMRKLNTSAGILEVMGPPLTGTDVKAYVMSGGGSKLKNFKLKFGGKRCFLIFPIRGSERRGLVNVEAKKKKGQYDFKLIAVDIPMATGPDQRIYLVGDEQEYRVGGGLIAELRDPIVKAMAAEKEFEDLDQKEEEEDKIREREEAKRKQREEEQRAVEVAEKRRLEEAERALEEADRRRQDALA